MARMSGLTLEPSWHRRWDAKHGMAKIYRVPPVRAWRAAAGARLERGFSAVSTWLVWLRADE